jgi:hypothetical protein
VQLISRLNVVLTCSRSDGGLHEHVSIEVPQRSEEVSHGLADLEACETALLVVHVEPSLLLEHGEEGDSVHHELDGVVGEALADVSEPAVIAHLAETADSADGPSDVTVLVVGEDEVSSVGDHRVEIEQGDLSDRALGLLSELMELLGVLDVPLAEALLSGLLDDGVALAEEALVDPHRALLHVAKDTAEHVRVLEASELGIEPLKVGGEGAAEKGVEEYFGHRISIDSN